MKISSDIVEVNKPSELVFEFLSNLNNYQPLFPEEKVKNWSSSEQNCSFLIKGMSVIEMQIHKLTKPEMIHLKSGSKAPFKFDIKIQVEASKDQEDLSAIQLIFDADVNPFMKMMIERPLSNFFNTMVASVPSKI